ncbi:MAG: DnaJ C-terminal domain-containing protein [Candidatus Sericytochromatia bacterium]|nr:DnaJ C-terminal domain-containing protein [Candidatus Sericytochromatia bacterium]
MKDYYKTLGVGRDATEDELRKAYRRLARRHHPDFNPGDPTAEARFKELTEAYDTLGDRRRREAYDARTGGARTAGRAAPDSGGAGGGLDALFGALFEAANEALEAVGAAASPPRRGADLEVVAEVTLAEVAEGTSVVVALTPPSGGTRRLRVRIPPGIEAGARIRVRGEGDPGDFGGPPGDLYVRVAVAPHPVLSREGKDLRVELPVSVLDARLGAEVEVPTLQGPVVLRLPPQTQGGSEHRLPGLGLPGAPGAERGDLRVRVSLRLPEEVSAEALPLWQALAGLTRRAALRV